MIRSLMLCLFGALSAVSVAQANSVTHSRGQIVSREACVDKGVFSASECRRAPLGPNRECRVSVTADSRGYPDLIRVSSSAWVEARDHRNNVLQGKLKKPYLYKDDFVAYNVKIDRTTSIEVKIRGRQAVAAYIYTNHAHSGSGNTEVRSFNQYFCTNLK